MVICSNLCELIKEQLRGDERFNNITLVDAYQYNIKPTPILKTIAAFSVKKCVLGDYIVEISDTGEETVTDNREALVTISVNLYVPYSFGSGIAPNVFESMIDCVTATFGNRLVSATCSETNYVRESQALVTKTEFVLRTVGANG